MGVLPFSNRVAIYPVTNSYDYVLAESSIRTLPHTRGKVDPENMALNLPSKILIRGTSLKSNYCSMTPHSDKCE